MSNNQQSNAQNMLNNLLILDPQLRLRDKDSNLPKLKWQNLLNKKVIS